ncbi:MAG: MBL fold metallo-hydrolase [Acidobacteriota bacterium]|nr:MBL fold metallo-hydrolase [Acidobacteriota bacterium]
MDVRFLPHGIFLPQLDLWLDPTEDCGTAWVSHGHSDHARGCHGRVYATPDTLRIYRSRLPESTPEACPVEFGVAWELGAARLTAYPASHIVGAAQLLIELEGERLLYTGDIKLRAPLCGRETQAVACDRLIVESTFGLPIYRFLAREAARDRMVAFARETLESGGIPAFIGYSLGRGQEIVHVLCEAGIPTAVHGSIARFIPIYEAAGYAFNGWTPYQSNDTAGKALVTVPSFRNILEASGKRYRIAYVSGWATLDNARARAGAEELIPYSDHADFEELIALVEGTGAREVDVVHGYTELFAHILSGRGIEARAPREASARATSEEVPEG